jgi:hypothetical protein
MRRASRDGRVGRGPRWAIAAAGIALSLALGCGPRGSEQDVDVVTRLATEFLRALDEDPASTWRELAAPLRGRVPEAEWPARIAGMRAPLGKPVARELASAAFSEELADAPPGPYFAVEFDSQFSDAACGERVVAIFERGRWRVVGYFVRNTRPRGARRPGP